jgi:hypothetical protein
MSNTTEESQFIYKNLQQEFSKLESIDYEFLASDIRQ